MATRGTLSSSTWRPHDRNLTAKVKPKFLLFTETHGAVDFHRTAERTRGRNPRSWCDRTAIAVRSSPNRGSFSAKSRELSFPVIRMAIAWAPTSRSKGDCGPIAAGSWHDRGAIVAPIEAESRPIYRQFRSHDIVNWNRFHNPCKPLPRPHQSATLFGLNFPLKSMYSPFLFFNSWLNREGIKRFEINILSSSWFPHV